MFVVKFRVGNESHDVYTFGEWLYLLIGDPEVWSFSLAEARAQAYIVAGWDDVMDNLTWHIASIERVHGRPYEALSGGGLILVDALVRAELEVA